MGTETPENETVQSEEEALWQELEDAEPEDEGAPDGAPEPEAPAAEEAPAASTDADLEEDSAPTAEDLWAGATPAQRAAFEDALAKIENQNKRVSGLTRKVNELMQAGQPAPDKGPGRKGKARDVLASQKWQDFEKEYTEVAEPIKEMVQAITEDQERHEQSLEAIDAERQDMAIGEQQELLEYEHQDWQQVVAAEGFVDWLNTQPRHIREAAMRNGTKIVDAAEAADVVGRFKAFRQQDVEPPAKGNGKSTLSGKRRRQLESATTTRSGGPGTVHGIPADGDEEAIWKAFDKQEQRDRQRA